MSNISNPNCHSKHPICHPEHHLCHPEHPRCHPERSEGYQEFVHYFKRSLTTFGMTAGVFGMTAGVFGMTEWVFGRTVMGLVCLVLFVQSCAPSLPEYKKKPQEKIATPKNFTEQDQQEGDEDLVRQNWQMFFEDKQLVALISSALDNNQALSILDQEISIANNEIMARQGQYLPKVGIGAGYDYEKTSKFSKSGVGDEAANLPDRLGTRQMGFNASWEVDIWKKLRNFAKSAYYEYLASVEGRNFAVTELVSEVANDYYELMALDNELNIVEQYIVTLKDAQKVVELQRIAARTTSLAVKRFDAEVAKNQSRKYAIKQQIVVTENHLNKLLGRLPQKIDRPSKQFVATEMQKVGTSIPAALLNNRPDLRQAFLKLQAAKLNVKAVKAQFYPSLNVDAVSGYKSFNARHFTDSPTAVFYDVAGSITMPLLNRNAIKAEYFSANNQQLEAIYDYEKIFINAFAEVVNQLNAVSNLEQSYALKQQQTKALAESFDISNVLFKAARVTYLESLLTRRDYLESQLELIEVKKQKIAAYIALYKALGGGWRSEVAKDAKK